jgi:predicted RNA-binding Zn ribbon-like protein
MVTRSEPDYVWDFCGGQLAIDLTNTVGNRGAMPEEHLKVFADVLSWAEARGVIDRAAAQRLARKAARTPTAATDAVTRIRELREALYRTIAAVAAGRKPAPADLARINAAVAAVYTGAQLQPEGRRLSLTFAEQPESTRLDQPIVTPVIRAAIELLTTDAIDRVRLCADHSCAWLFVDSTRSGTRRWCDMKICGNRNKVRRFREAQP